jgi:glycosyltransferase involved in cell wall biosynthesis
MIHTMPSLLSLNSYHYRRGGSEAVYFEHEAMFRALGWQTAHMAMHHPKNLTSEWSEFFVDEIEFGHSYGLLDKLAMAGKVIYSFEARRKLAALLDRFPASIAHVHGIHHHLSPSVLPLLRERGVPVVLTAHDLKIACPAYKMLNRGGVCEKCKGGNLLHLIANRCVRDSVGVSTLVAVESAVAKSLGLYRRNVNRVVAPSAFYRSKLLEWGWPENQVIFIPNYVDAEQHIPQYAPGNYFLYFGRLAPEKGVATLIHAAKKAGVQLKVVGTGPLEDELKALVAGSSVDMLGYRSGEALWSLVRDCRAVVLPSEWYENAPMSVLESFALGKPVIGARIGGIPEMVIEGETGYTFDSGSVDALATRLTEMAALPDAAVSAMGQRARVLVSTRYTASRYRAAMLDLYAELGAIPARLPVG